jgi:hypothetical protein
LPPSAATLDADVSRHAAAAAMLRRLRGCHAAAPTSATLRHFTRRLLRQASLPDAADAMPLAVTPPRLMLIAVCRAAAAHVYSRSPLISRTIIAAPSHYTCRRHAIPRFAIHATPEQVPPPG